MPVRKETCRNFQRGSCQYGERCRYLHVTQQQQPRANSNAFGFGFQQKQQNQSSNPFGFGVQSKPSNDFANKQQQFKPFENKWTRFSPISNGGTPPSRQSDNQPQPANHKCTDSDSCKRQIVEDFEHEKPLWKLTCYGHSKNGPCDIVGDVSYEELRAAAYDDAKRGLSLQSIVERERNLLNSKLIEFENLLRNPYVAPQKSVHSKSSFPGVAANGILPTGQNSGPPAVSSFSQLGASLSNRPSTPSSSAFGQPNLSNASQTSGAFGIRPSVPSNNAFGLPNVISNSSQPASAFGMNNFTAANAGFSNASVVSNQNNPFSSSAVSTKITNLSNTQPLVTSSSPNPSSIAVGQATTHVHSVNDMQKRNISVDNSIWLKENWIAGEIPEDAPPDEYI